MPLSNDRVLVSFRNISTLAIIDKRTDGFAWKLGSEVLAQQHDPSLLPNGHILVFDNGVYRPHNELPFSRVIEIDPQTNDVIWQYRDNPPYNFFSPLMSGACCLPNGNILITEAVFGRLFEITPAGEVVWEYINPHFPSALDGLPDNSIFRASHYLVDEIPVELPE